MVSEIERARVTIAECASKRDIAYGEAKSLCEYLYPISLRRDDSAEETVDTASDEKMPAATQLFRLIDSLRCM